MEVCVNPLFKSYSHGWKKTIHSCCPCSLHESKTRDCCLIGILTNYYIWIKCWSRFYFWRRLNKHIKVFMRICEVSGYKNLLSYFLKNMFKKHMQVNPLTFRCSCTILGFVLEKIDKK
jgi:hypothetical protein